MINIISIWVCFWNNLGKPRYKRATWLMFFFLLSQWTWIRHLMQVAIPVDNLEEQRRLHTLNIQSRILTEKGTGCNIPNTNPFSKEIVSLFKNISKPKCKGNEWVTCKGSQCFLNYDIADRAKIECYYSDIIHVHDKKYYIDKPVKISGYQVYNLNKSDHVKVMCYRRTLFLIPHFLRWPNKFITTGLRPVEVKVPKGRENSLNVLVLCFDSVSHNQFLRKLPKSYQILNQIFGAVVLNKYNILGDGTSAALFPILTGKHELEMAYARKIYTDTYFDVKQFLFGMLHNDGYHTAYFEDHPKTGTFQMQHNGFASQPADHYLRDFFLEASNKYCVGGVASHQLLLNLTQQFLAGKGKRFCFTMISECSHDDQNLIGTIEDDLSDFLMSLKSDCILENTLVIVMADHGARFQKLRMTRQGKMEERLPFVSITVPEELKRVRKNAYESLKGNIDVLTTPYDIHTTILDAVGLKHKDVDYKVPGSDLRRGLSLLEPILPSRSCADADILAHWCACMTWVNVLKENEMFKSVARALADHINSILSGNTNCARRELVSIEWVRRLSLHEKAHEVNKSVYRNLFNRSKPLIKYYQTQIVMSPGKAIFEGTVLFLKAQNSFLVSQWDISRLNAYIDESHCVLNVAPHLRKFCYCKKSWRHY